MFRPSSIHLRRALTLQSRRESVESANVSLKLCALRTFGTSAKPETLYIPPWVKDPDADSEIDPTPSMYPVTSAHMIDVVKQEPSALDSVAIDPSSPGKVVHARYGDLGEIAAAIPLEYLALLHPAAIGAAAVREITSKAGDEKGVIAVYGVSQASGWAAAQIAESQGHAVIAVIDSLHSGDNDFCEMVKHSIKPPSVMVPEEYAISKKNFKELVDSVVNDDHCIAERPASEYLDEFKELFIAYSKDFPDTRPAAVSQDKIDFHYQEKDREFWGDNIDTYYAQFPPGAPPVDKAKLDKYFTEEEYDTFREKFWQQTTAVMNGLDPPFSAPHLVHDAINGKTMGVDVATTTMLPPDSSIPYYLSLTNPILPKLAPARVKGRVLGAIIHITPELAKAMSAVSKANTKREKVEALAYLTESEKGMFKAACSVAAQAKGTPVVFIDNIGEASVAGKDLIKPTDEDVQTVLEAMDIDEDGESSLNFFVQAYRANFSAFYEDYSVFRASEPLAGPRQIILTK